VTPLQIKNIQDMVEGLDLDTDLDVLDGWDEIDEDFQEKIKHALRLGHVADEDWRGVSPSRLSCCSQLIRPPSHQN
jgi:hypothetical protein